MLAYYKCLRCTCLLSMWLPHIPTYARRNCARFLPQVYRKDSSVCPNNLISISVTISISATWFVGAFDCRRVGLSASCPVTSRIYHTLSDCRSLEHRRIRADLIEVYKIIHGLSNVKFFTCFEYSDEHRTRGHSLKLQKHHVSTSTSHFFSERIINVWNKLDGNTVTAPTYVELLQATL